MVSSIQTDIKKILSRYKGEAEVELESIVLWWLDNMEDEVNGGYFGSVNNENIPDQLAAKGIVLNSRILWTCSAVYRLTKKDTCLQAAQRAFEYIIQYFIDHEYGGVFWSVNQQGKMLDGRKQIYGLAFCMYGISEYYKVSGDEAALHIAKELYAHIEKYSLDKINGGYTEAFTREWNTLYDQRLSEKDDNERKTMNTHLHIIEAYANLYTVWPDKILREKIAVLLVLFDKYIINKNHYHLNLFMDDEWNVKSTLQSFGHDIEAAWLLHECAETAGYQLYIDKYKSLSIKLADAAAEGLDKDGGLWYEYEPLTEHWIKEKHSWPQAEAMVGFLNAWQLTGAEKYLQYSLNAWQFIRQYIRDDKNGEWFWGVNKEYAVMNKEKAGFWKCPYHNARACIELIKRITG
jgi:cellobiose epimerase